MQSRRIPYYKRDGRDFWEQNEARHLVTVLRVIADPTQRRGLDNALRWLGLTEEGLGILHGVSPEDFAGKTDQLKGLDRSLIRGFNTKYQGWRRQKDRIPLVVHAVALWFEQVNGAYVRENVLRAAARVLSSLEHDDLLSRLAWIAEQGKTKDQSIPEGHCALLTMHSAKGLEFDNVWIAGAQEFTIPSEHATVPEERRIMYVAITRARERLFFSYHEKPSRFLVEAGVPIGPAAEQTATA